MKKKKITAKWVLIRLLTLIFLYSVAVKIGEFERFSSELAKSPFLHDIAGVISIVVPLTEFAVTILLLVNKTRLGALYAYLYMMTAFTCYVYLMMEKAYFLPCACMGLIDTLGWGAHLVINCILTMIVLTAILMDENKLTKINLNGYHRPVVQR